MNKARSFFVFFLTLSFLSVSCGLEEYYILEPTIFIRNAIADDPTNRIYQFRTNETSNAELGNIFTGTVVYYKIYNSESQMNSAISSISSSNTEYSQNGINKLKSLDYKELLLTNSRDTVLIPKNGNNRTIGIRLYDEGSYPIGFSIDGSIVDSPLRYNRRRFIDTDDFGGDDTVITSGFSLDEWYITAYAVSYGLDPYLSPIYSTVLHLGSIYIKNPKK